MSQEQKFKVVISGAAGQIAYSLLPLICGGSVFGKCRVDLRLLDIESSAEALQGVAMEIQDSAFHLADEIITTTNVQVAFQDVDVAILVGGFPRKQGMLRKDLIEKNTSIFKAQGEAIEKYASRNVKVLVVANPANTNCYVAMKHAPSIPKTNFSCLTRLDHERLRSSLVVAINEKIYAGTVNLTQPVDSKVRVNAGDLRKCIIWGNHSSTQFPDSHFAQVNMSKCANFLNGDEKWISVKSIIQNDEWLSNELITTVQQRGAAVIKARKLSSAMSAAAAIAAHLRDWIFGTAEGDYVSMGILSDGNPYDIPNDIIYSFPVTCRNGEYSIVPGLEIDGASRNLLNVTAQELLEEKVDAMDILTRKSNL